MGCDVQLPKGVGASDESEFSSALTARTRPGSTSIGESDPSTVSKTRDALASMMRMTTEASPEVPIASLIVVCVTTVVLVFAVERGKRVEAIQALPDLIAVIVCRTRSHSVESGRGLAPSSTSPVASEPCSGRRDEDVPRLENRG